MGAGIILMAYDNQREPRLLGLIGDEKTRKKHNAIYDLPKGTEDYGESSLDCAIRETFEETSITIKRSELIEGPFKTNFLTMWLAEIPINTPVVIERNPQTGLLEHEGYDWLTREQALKHTYPYLVPFVQWAFKCF